jgi:hypothetical protein
MPTLEILWWETIQQLPFPSVSAGGKPERWASRGLQIPPAPAPMDRWDFMRPETATKLRSQTCPAKER